MEVVGVDGCPCQRVVLPFFAPPQAVKPPAVTTPTAAPAGPQPAEFTSHPTGQPAVLPIWARCSRRFGVSTSVLSKARPVSTQLRLRTAKTTLSCPRPTKHAFEAHRWMDLLHVPQYRWWQADA